MSKATRVRFVKGSARATVFAKKDGWMKIKTAENALKIFAEAEAGVIYDHFEGYEFFVHKDDHFFKGSEQDIVRDAMASMSEEDQEKIRKHIKEEDLTLTAFELMLDLQGKKITYKKDGLVRKFKSIK